MPCDKFEYFNLWLLTYIMNISDIIPSLSNKSMTALLKFYNDNDENTYTYKKKNMDTHLIMSYNLHLFDNISAKIHWKTNVDNIVGLISLAYIDTVVFQEMNYYSDKFEYLLEKMNEIKYDNHVLTYNGGSHPGDLSGQTSCVAIFSRHPIKSTTFIDLTVSLYVRKCIIAEINGIIIANVHLEIGDRFHYYDEGSDKRNEIIAKNTKNRITQLTDLLNYGHIDVIIGDFNFMHTDDEYQWLINKGFEYTGTFEDTTPFNRTDFAFVNKKTMKCINNTTIKSNYSDHLPILCEVISIYN